MTDTTTTKKPRTQRVYREGNPMSVGPGASTQDGTLPLYECTTCGREVVWATSTRTGRKYLADVYQGQVVRYYVKRSPHKCQDHLAPRARNELHDFAMDWNRATVKTSRAIAAGLKAGAITEAEATAAWAKVDDRVAAAKLVDELDGRPAIEAAGRIRRHLGWSDFPTA